MLRSKIKLLFSIIKRSYEQALTVAGRLGMASVFVVLVAVPYCGTEVGNPQATVDINDSGSNADDLSNEPDQEVNSSDPLVALGDTFSGSALSDDWDIYNPGGAGLEVKNGSLRVTATQQMLWYNTSASGVLISKEISGDFRVTIGVKTRRIDSSDAPTASVKLAGAMAQDPDTATNNYSFIVLGYDENDLSVEVKNTVDDVSTYDGPAWPDGEGQVRICRVGNEFRFYVRAETGDDWELQDPPQTSTNGAGDFSNFTDGVLTRSDMPAALNVGMNVYAQGDYDLRADFDFIHYRTPGSVADCTTD